MKEKTGINEKTSNGVKKLHVLLADPVRDLSLNGVKLIVLAFAFAQMASAADWFVTTNGTGEGTSWADATNSIQGAIGASSAGDTVWVSNGVYDTGGILYSGQTNRVAITNAITVRSANNDPANTIIKGAWDPATNGPSAVRCVYMIDGSALIGFTLTNGATAASGYGGGIWCQSTNTVVSNCVITGNSAKRGGGAYYGTLYNCTLTGNSALGAVGSQYGGGGTYNATLYNCTLSGNSASHSDNSGDGGGGARGGILSNCTLSGNSGGFGAGVFGANLYDCALTGNLSSKWGGGAYGSTLSNCTIVGNSAGYGGGTYGGTVYNCTIVSNTATYCAGSYLGTLYNCTLSYNSSGAQLGGGAYGGALYNCLLIGNSANYGGGARAATLYNCTIVGNWAISSGGGVYEGTMYNCISWDNNKVDSAATWYYSCAASITGDGTITNNPLFIADGSGFGTNHVAGNYRLSDHSPCVNTGTNFSWMTDPGVRSKDLDGNPRIDNFSGQVDMGCYEHLQRRFTIIRIH